MQEEMEQAIQKAIADHEAELARLKEEIDKIEKHLIFLREAWQEYLDNKNQKR